MRHDRSVFFRRLCHSLFNGKFFGKIRRHLFLVDGVRNTLSKLALRHPVEPRKVLFCSFSGGVECNPKYIALELARRRKDVDIVWFIDNHAWRRHRASMPERMRCVRMWTYRAMKEAATAKILVENAQRLLFRDVPPKRAEQYLVNTWHGSLGIKRLSTAKTNVRKKAQILEEQVDVVLTDSKFEEEVFSTSFFPSTPKLRIGHARNDVFYLPLSEREAIASRVRLSLGIGEGEKIALYAPTFREATFFLNANGLDFDAWVKSLASRFGGKWRIAVRLHPHDARALEDGVFSLPKSVLDLSSYEDIQELLVMADVCITDYSSLIFDFLHSRKPGFIYAPDKAKYDENRGFCYPLEETPFPIAETEAELCSCIETFDAALFAERADKFIAARGAMEEAGAARRAVDLIEALLNNDESSIRPAGVLRDAGQEGSS